MKRTVIATLSMLVSSTGFGTEVPEDGAHYAGRQIGVYYTGGDRTAPVTATPRSSATPSTDTTGTTGTTGNTDIAGAASSRDAVWGAASKAEREAHAIAASEMRRDVQASDARADGIPPSLDTRPMAVAPSVPADDASERLAVSTLAMHAARVMGAQTSRMVGLDSVEPTVAIPDARAAKRRASDQPASEPGPATLGSGHRPRHAELVRVASPGAAALSSGYDALIDEAAARHRVAPHLVRAVIKVESNFQAQARSPKGALGLMQVMPATGKRFGAVDLRDPRENVNAGTRYLRWLLDRFDDDLTLTLAAYNAGEGAVERHGRRIPPYAETQGYVAKVLGHLGFDASGAMASAGQALGAGPGGGMPAIVAARPAAERRVAAGQSVAPGEAARALRAVSGWVGAFLTSGSRRPAEGAPGDDVAVPVAERYGDGFQSVDDRRRAVWPERGERTERTERGDWGERGEWGERDSRRVGFDGRARPV
ncbi:lytic transglycosylase domain-containing protein [Paracidovorax citrulli]